MPKIQEIKKITRLAGFGPGSTKIGFDRLCQGLKIDFLQFGTPKTPQNHQKSKTNQVISSDIESKPDTKKATNQVVLEKNSKQSKTSTNINNKVKKPENSQSFNSQEILNTEEMPTKFLPIPDLQSNAKETNISALKNADVNTKHSTITSILIGIGSMITILLGMLILQLILVRRRNAKRKKKLDKEKEKGLQDKRNKTIKLNSMELSDTTSNNDSMLRSNMALYDTGRSEEMKKEGEFSLYDERNDLNSTENGIELEMNPFAIIDVHEAEKQSLLA